MDANLKARLTTAAIGLPVLIALVGWAPEWLFAAAIFLLTLAALQEYFAMAFPNCRADRVAGIALGAALSSIIFLGLDSGIGHWLGMLLVLIFSVTVFSGIKSSHKSLLILLGGFYGGFLLPHWLALFRQPQGRFWVFWVLIVIMIGDTLAYFVGKGFGRRKLAPEISPGKTVEGAWAYICGAVVAGLASAPFLLAQVRWLEILPLSLGLAIFGQLGDLFESRIKRLFAVKDSGRMLPGHGGVLDRVDSLVFPAVWTVAYLRVFQS